MGGIMKKAGKAAEGVFSANDQATLQGEQLGMPPTPMQGMLSTAGDIFTAGKSIAQIAQPGPAPNSAWGNLLLTGGKTAASFLGEMLMPGGGADMVGAVLDQAKAVGDVMLPGGTAGAAGALVHQVTGLGGGAEPAAEGAAPAAPATAAPPAPAALAPAPAPTPAPAPAPAPRQFPSSPLASDADVFERLSR